MNLHLHSTSSFFSIASSSVVDAAVPHPNILPDQLFSLYPFD